MPFDLGTLTAIEFALMAGVESFRGAAEPEKRVYPGGAFDPMGLVSCLAESLVLLPGCLAWPRLCCGCVQQAGSSALPVREQIYLRIRLSPALHRP